MPFLDILIFAAIALFLIFRLRSILGNRDGFEQQQEKKSPFEEAPAQNENDNSNNVVRLKSDKDFDPAANGTGMEAVKRADSDFQDAAFMQGAVQAFQIILKAFADGNLDKLRGMLGFELYEAFERAIHERTKKGNYLDITLHEIESARLMDGRVEDYLASVTVKFLSRQTRILKNSEEKTVEDESYENNTISDVWTFERDLKFKDDPNWRLVEAQEYEGDEEQEVEEQQETEVKAETKAEDKAEVKTKAEVKVKVETETKDGTASRSDDKAEKP